MFIKHQIQLYTNFICKLNNLNVTEKIFDIFLIVNAYIIFVGQLYASQVQKTQYLSLDYLIISTIKYTYFTNTLREGLLFDEHRICITVSAFHVAIISLYAIIGKFYEKYNHTRTIDSITLILSFFHKVYIWAMVVPSLSYLFYYIMAHYDSKILWIIACLSSLLSIIYAVIILKSNGYVDFYPKKFLCVRNSHAFNIFYCGQVSLSTLEFFKGTLPPNISIIIHSSLNIILACILIRFYWIDLPYPNSTISKAYGFMNFYLIYLTILALVSIFFAEKLTHIWLFLLMGALFTYKLSRTLRKSIILHILTISDYNKLSKCRFDYLVRKIKKYFDPSVSKKMKSMFYLTLFIRNHVLNCREITCVCHLMRVKVNKDENEDDNPIPKQVFDSIDFMDKAEIMYTCKKLILDLVKQLFRQLYCKENIDASSKDIDMHILYMLYLLDEQRYYEAYIESVKLKELGVKLNQRQLYQIEQTKSRLCKIILEDTHIKDRYKFQDFILQQDLTQHLKDQMSILFENYVEFYEKPHENIANINLIIQKAKIILKLRKKIVNIANAIYEIEPLSLEIKQIWNIYLSLHIVKDQKCQREAIPYQLLKKNQLGIGSSTLHDNIHVNLYDPKSCLMFINITHKNFGQFIKVSQYATQIFGYEKEDLKMQKIETLMPRPYIDLYKNYFFENATDDTQTTNTYLPEVYGIEKEGFLIALEIYFNIEPLYNELTGVLWTNQILRENSIILTDSNGFMLNHTKSIQNLIPLTQNSKIHLAFLIPSTILNFIDHDIQNFFQKDITPTPTASPKRISNIQANNLPSIPEIILNPDDNYIIIPKSFLSLNFSKSVYASLVNTNKEPFNKNKQYMLMQALAKIYSSYDISNVVIYQIFGELRAHKFEAVSLYLNVFAFKQRALKINKECMRRILSNYKCFLNSVCEAIAMSQQSNLSIKILSGTNLLNNQESMKDQFKPSREYFNNNSTNITNICVKLQDNELIDINKEFKAELSENWVTTLIDIQSTDKKLPDNCYKFLPNDQSNLANRENIDNTNNNKLIFIREPNHSRKTSLAYSNKNLISTRRPSIADHESVDSLRIRDQGKGEKCANDDQIVLELNAYNSPRGSYQIPSHGLQYSRFHHDLHYSSLNFPHESPSYFPKNSIYHLHRDNSGHLPNDRLDHENSDDDSRSVSEFTTNQNRKLGKQLANKSRSKLLHRTKSLGIICLIILIGIFSIASILWIYSLMMHLVYIHINEFSAKSSVSISFFYKILNTHFLHQDNMFVTDEKYLQIFNKENLLKDLIYTDYRDVYANVILNNFNEYYQSIASNNENLSMNISLLKADDNPQDYTFSFISSMNILMQKINDVISIIEKDGNSNDSTVYFFQKNHIVYFKVLLSQNQNIQKYISESSSLYFNFNIQRISLVFTITNSLIVLIILGVIFPLWRHAQKIKNNGLRLLALYSPQEMNYYAQQVLNAQSLISGLNEEAIVNSTRKNEGLNGDEHSRKSVKFNKNNSIITVVLGFILVYSLIEFFLIFKHVYTTNKYNNLIDLMLHSYDFANQYANWHARFAIAFQALTLYNTNSTWQEFYKISYLPILEYFHNAIETDIRFYANLDEFINQLDNAESILISKYSKLKWGDLCDFITLYPMTSDNITECKIAFHQATKYGFPSLLNMVYDGLANQENIIVKGNYSRNASYYIINDQNISFSEMHNLLYYMTLVFLEMLDVLNQSSIDILNIQIRYRIIFDIAEIILTFGLTLTIWYLFLKRFTNEIFDVKRVYCILPIELINKSNNIKRWITQN